MMISWSPPPLGWLKVNSHGALEVETAMATSGGAIRDYRGQWLVGFARNIGYATVTDAELWWVVTSIAPRRGASLRSPQVGEPTS
ncbi:hypothetical protein J1N35_031173 [Gossypium stocksii]|uniref:RNase H type-1 domain-containing protein n=1 Tax=Gossypium stocksii TaxID=47602 RepID=A0A9D3ZTJ2_9ROSI|nr:hypothetical protein J1N35_031173 [Gossypium stocksii]